MPRKQPELTNSTIKQIRANQARRVSAILTRVAKFAEGTLTDNEGNKVDLSAAELKAAQLIRDTVLPAQQASTIEDLTPEQPNQADMETRAKQARETLLAGIGREELKAMLEAMDSQTQW